MKNVLSAEVTWALKTVDLYYSYSSCANAGELFKVMFPDSGIAAKFSCGEANCAYLSTLGCKSRITVYPMVPIEGYLC